jgi:hypothetical protein
MVVLPRPPALSPFPKPKPPSILSLLSFKIDPMLYSKPQKQPCPFTIIPLGYLVKPPLGLNIIIRSFSFKVKYYRPLINPKHLL